MEIISPEKFFLGKGSSRYTFDFFCVSFLLLIFLFLAVLSLKMETKGKGLKEQQRHHKKLLAAMLSQDSFDSIHSPTPSIAEEEMEDEDDAMELLGNVTVSQIEYHKF